MEGASAGAHLRTLRVRQGLTARKVADLSRQLATRTGREGFELSHTRLLQVESGASTPSIYKLYALSVIYGTSVTHLASLYVDADTASECHVELGLPNTHLMECDVAATAHTIDFPLAFTPSASASQTTIISELVSVWGHVPAVLLARLNLRRCRYGLIGLNDYTMYPLLRPGSFVRIEKLKKWNHSYSNEYQRPILFLEHREGYICSWCEIHNNRLFAIPHPLSSCKTKVFAYPDDAEIVGVVTAIAVPLTEPQPRPAEDLAAKTEAAEPQLQK
jgi:transcriptional regulator with XRE-family HTH domain